MGDVKRIDAWRLERTDKNNRPYLVGAVGNNWTSTSTIVEVLPGGKVVKTISGSLYGLGSPFPETDGVLGLPEGIVEQPPFEQWVTEQPEKEDAGEQAGPERAERPGS